MENSTRKTRKTTVILTLEQEAEACRLFVAGMKAKDVARRFDISRSTASKMFKRHECRRCDLGQDRNLSRRKQSDEEVRRGALAVQRPPATRALLRLGDDAATAEAAAAAHEMAMAFLKQGDAKRALEFLRVEQALVRAAGGSGTGEDPTEPGRRAALDFLWARGVDLSGETEA